MIGGRTFVGAGACLMAIAFAAPAQAQQAGIQIAVVRGDNGAPVANAAVILENRELAIRRPVQTDAQGQARVEGLTTGGACIVTFEGSSAFGPAQSAPIKLRSNFTRSVTLRLAPAGDEVIVVVGTRAVTGINTVNAEVSGSLDERALRDLPVEGRDVITALVRLPNVVASTGFFPEAPVISINGRTGSTPII